MNPIPSLTLSGATGAATRLASASTMLIALDRDYQWAIVGEPDRDYLWFLARTPEVSPDLLERMKSIALGQGYDLAGLYLVPQKER